VRLVVLVVAVVAAALLTGCDRTDSEKSATPAPAGSLSPSSPASIATPSPGRATPATAAPTATATPTPTPTPTPAPAEVGADELGRVPVLMYHRLIADGGGPYDRTPQAFRAELRWLFEHDYVPVVASELLDGRIDIPAGTKPVVLTFDDSSREQAQFEDGEPAPETALGILTEVAADYPDVEPVAVWSVLPAPFGGDEKRGRKIMRKLHERGHELANHSCSHTPLSGRSRAEVARDLVCGANTIRDAVPDAEVRVLTLPLGRFPDQHRWAETGETPQGRYDHDALLKVGARPAPSPFHADFEPLALPRIRSGNSTQQSDFESAFWLRRLEAEDNAYVSDGDPQRISFPAQREAQLDAAFGDRANPYQP
jgi:peptidoglycan/xylan/chitin deacetylase (PgdA/CDA1 family)